MSEGKKETILVTGSSGRIGYPLAKRLAKSFNVVGFDRKAPSHPPPSAECLYVDLTNEESTRRGLQAIRDLHGDRIASVIHLAAYYDFSGAPSPLYDKVTVGGTRRLLRLLQDFKVEQFIFSSTILVQASSRHGMRIKEDIMGLIHCWSCGAKDRECCYEECECAKCVEPEGYEMWRSDNPEECESWLDKKDEGNPDNEGRQEENITKG